MFSFRIFCILCFHRLSLTHAKKNNNKRVETFFTAQFVSHLVSRELADQYDHKPPEFSTLLSCLLVAATEETVASKLSAVNII